MDLSRAVYSRDLKITAMRALDAGSATSEIARKYQLSPKLLEHPVMSIGSELTLPPIAHSNPQPTVPYFG